ncbi:MAG: hypothetical protein R2825_25060 [Saprospiraceae bacterium]
MGESGGGDLMENVTSGMTFDLSNAYAKIEFTSAYRYQCIYLVHQLFSPNTTSGVSGS